MSKTADGPITFFDVETTGLTSDDRVVSLGLLTVKSIDDLAAGGPIEPSYLIFNPGRASHPRARKVHGYSDELLAAQDMFDVHADTLFGHFNQKSTLVAHNASFDRRFMTNEFASVGKVLKGPTFYCTMLEHRRRKTGHKSGLDAILQQMQRPPRQGTHGALSDAWHAMSVYCWLNDLPLPTTPPALARPLNYRDATASPPTPLPMRASNTKSAAYTAAYNRLLPLATVLILIARADGEVLEAEVETLSLLMHTMLIGMDQTITMAEQQDLLAALVSLEPNSDDVVAACQRIASEHDMRIAVAGWVRQITNADGSASPAEHAAILQVLSAMKKAQQLAR